MVMSMTSRLLTLKMMLAMIVPAMEILAITETALNMRQRY